MHLTRFVVKKLNTGLVRYSDDRQLFNLQNDLVLEWHLKAESFSLVFGLYKSAKTTIIVSIVYWVLYVNVNNAGLCIFAFIK